MGGSTGEVVVGDLATINCDGLQYSPEGFAMGYFDGSKFLLAEMIDIETFPSFKDFQGPTTRVNHGELVLVTKLVGRPWKISTNNQWRPYDIFEILIGEQRCQIFRHNLKHYDRRVD
ncbi:MAG TPA: hypothetical protein EYG51_25995 [Pseudomonadales bacterium]|nr:hypothetical protein [Pseudomonadales bacterium]